MNRVTMLLALVVVLIGSGVSRGEVVPDFAFFAGDPPYTGQIVCLEYGDNLMIRDPNGDSVVSGAWHMGGFIQSGGGLVLGMFAENIYRDYEGWGGWLKGIYLENLGVGGRPEVVMLVHDPNDNGIGTFDGGVWTLGDDDTLYYFSDVLVGPEEVRGDISQFPVYDGISYPLWLPHMVVSPLDCNGNGVPDAEEFISDGDFDCDGDVDLDDYIAFAESMAGPGSVPNVSTECQYTFLRAFDSDEDGDIDMKDFAVFTEVFNDGL